jgi:hypothetical protein
MTHPIYTESALAKLSVSQLAEIACELGATPTGDKQQRDSWVECIFIHQSGIAKVSIEVPTDLIEEKTLELLGVEIVDRQDHIEECVPHGDIRFWVYRCNELIGTISTWVIGEEDSYHPTDYSNPKQYSRFDSLFGAVCQLLPKQELEVTYRDAFQILKQRFDSTPDYI